MAYDTIEADGQEIFVEDGETWENKLIDFDTGERFVVRARGNDWTIRNIGFSGTSHNRGDVVMSLQTDGGDGTVEYVYMGDGSTDHNDFPIGHGTTGIHALRTHSGHIDISRCYVAGFHDSGFQLEPPARDGGGSVDVDTCFSANNYVSQYQMGIEGEIRDSVALVDSSDNDGRGVWAKAPGPITVIGCDVDMNGRHYSFEAGGSGQASHLHVEDTQWDTSFGSDGTFVRYGGTMSFENTGTNPDTSPPDGVPTSAVEAADRDAGDPDPPDPDPGAPGAPTNLNVQDVDGPEVFISWVASPDDVDHYNLYVNGMHVGEVSGTTTEALIDVSSREVID